jgi:heterodisulfide reductase subunit D
MSKKEVSKLEEYRDKVYMCWQCGMCRIESYEGLDGDPSALFMDVCPTWKQWDYLEVYTGYGKNEIARGILEGTVPLDEKTAEILYGCTLCGACGEQCHAATQTRHLENAGAKRLPYNPFEIAQALRDEAVRKGVGPLPVHTRFAKNIAEKHNPYNEMHEKRTEWLTAKLPEKADVVYFVGCTAAYRRPEIVKDGAAIFQKAGVKFTVAKDEWCCGSPLMTTGQEELVKEVAQHNIDTFKAAGVKQVITSCAGCYRALKEYYPELVGELPFKVKHITEFLEELVKDGRLKPTKNVDMTVTYHDPCHLGRHMKVYDAPRTILKAIPGLKLVEMNRKLDYSFCCGAGAGFKSAFPEKAVNIASERVREAEQLNVDALVTACTFCKYNLSDGAQAITSKLPVYDIEELLVKAL